MLPNQELYRDLYKNARMLVVLKLIFDLGGSATVVQLSKILDVHHESITENIYRLADRNMLERPRRRGGWFLTRLGMSFLMAEKPPFALTTTTTTIEESDQFSVEVEVFNKQMAEKPPFVNDIWRAFTEIGITRNARTEQVARTPGLTYDGVIKKWEQLKSQDKAWPGLLIQILPTLTSWELRGHTDHCWCDACRGDHAQSTGSKRSYGDWDNV